MKCKIHDAILGFTQKWMQVSYERGSDAFFQAEWYNSGYMQNDAIWNACKDIFLHTRWFKWMRQARDSDM